MENKTPMQKETVALLATALTLAGAGIMLLTGKSGQKNRERVQKWVDDLKHVDLERYLDLAEILLKRYRDVKRDVATTL